MNDINKKAVPAFNIEPAEETINTRCFGQVRIRDIGAQRIEALLTAHQEEKDNMPLLRAILCEAGEGPHGERFTRDLLDRLPARAFRDSRELMVAAGRVNGLAKDDVGKA
jgi:hypothetical protein